MQRIDILPKQNCTGCAACTAICPKKCINMKEDNEGGYLYPTVHEDYCINCGLCAKVCQGFKYEFFFHHDISAYVGVSSEEERQKSASGGATAAITDAFLEGGVVYGSTFTSDLKVEHRRAATPEEASLFRKSKYIQSDIALCYKQIEDDLKKGLKVLFTGTSCQCAAIYKYLEVKKIDATNLYTINLLCHGVPSQKLFDEYIKEQHVKHGKIINISFRNKKPYNGVINSRTAEIVYESGEVRIVGIEQDPYLKMYYSKLAYRPSCMECKYSRHERVADITVADAWKIDRIKPQLNPLVGISMILVNSEKGKEALSLISSSFHYEAISAEWALNSQKLFSEPTKAHANRERFLKSYQKEGFEYSVWKYTRASRYIRLKIFVKSILNNILHND